MVLRALFELFRRYHDNPAGTAVALSNYKTRANSSSLNLKPHHLSGWASGNELSDQPQRHKLARLLSSNAQWAADVHKYEPSFFRESAKGQAPKVLWIGCADSRVPESVIMACKPGEIFVHRNIANQFHLDDDSGQSVLAYAVEHLGVEHVVVVGHTQCGGIAGAYDAACAHGHHGAPSKACNSPLERWLAPLISLAAQPEFMPCITNGDSDAQPNGNGVHVDTAQNRSALLTELSKANVRAQVENIVASEVIRGAWASVNSGILERKRVYVHGWVYDLENGRLNDLGVSQGPEGFVGHKFVGGLELSP